MATRGCGDRVAGGVYACCGLSPHGSPIEEFLIDPPVVVDRNDYGLSSKGTAWMERDGTWHLLDIVGEKYYPNVADFVEEARRYGVSRRLSSKLEFERLGPGSRLILLHRRAHIDNAAEYRRERPCPKRVPEHCPGHEGHLDNMCAGLWWEDVTDHEEVAEGYEGREVTRKMPSFSYTAQCRPFDVKPEYSLAIFASFPIWNLEVINDPEGGKHEKNLERARKARVKNGVHLLDE